MKTTGNTILITGGGSGIGRALAHAFHDRGDAVIVAGRREAPLRETAAGRERIDVAVVDVDHAGSLSDAVRAIVDRHPALNVLVNNAGIMRLEPVDARRDLSDAEATVATNIMGPVRLTDALIEHLKRKPDAAIVNVTSGLAFVPMVDAAVYSATKAFMHSYTVSLREALRGQVEVIELAPPGVRTTLTPGQQDRNGYMPLDAFVAEAMALFDTDPTPEEMPVQRARMLRSAEADGRFAATLEQLNRSAREQRGA